jgi:hypothetical protein
LTTKTSFDLTVVLGNRKKKKNKRGNKTENFTLYRIELKFFFLLSFLVLFWNIGSRAEKSFKFAKHSEFHEYSSSCAFSLSINNMNIAKQELYDKTNNLWSTTKAD